MGTLYAGPGKSAAGLRPERQQRQQQQQRRRRQQARPREPRTPKQLTQEEEMRRLATWQARRDPYWQGSLVVHDRTDPRGGAKRLKSAPAPPKAPAPAPAPVKVKVKVKAKGPTKARRKAAGKASRGTV